MLCFSALKGANIFPSSNVVASIIITVNSLCKWMNSSCFHWICFVCGHNRLNRVSMNATSQLNFNYPILILYTKRTARTNWCPYFDHLHVSLPFFSLSCWQMKYNIIAWWLAFCSVIKQTLKQTMATFH